MISGTTEIIAHIGVPTANFRSPLIYNPWFEQKGIDAVVVPMGCESADYPGFLRILFNLTNTRGALVTMPHKVTTAGLVDVLSPEAKICGACNAVRRDGDGRLVGAMFDGEGFVRAMRSQGRDPHGASALVVGAGGVGSAIAASLAAAGVARLALFDLNTASSEDLARRLAPHHPRLALSCGSADPQGFDIVVNATPLGMKVEDPLPLDAGRIDAGAYLGDVVMAGRETSLLKAAREKGCAVQPGLDMLFEQIPAYLEFFGFPEASARELRELAQPATPTASTRAPL
ncbi:shikimate dehydrogenase family protein [Hoeflea sp.]|uniref:shikimate dehydrogenase family protein n=1 Tax=Hoeflea sp. TaxID=1940281 RepID=UPI003B52F99F